MILLPTIVFTTDAAIVLNVLLRDKYLVYAMCFTRKPARGLTENGRFGSEGWALMIALVSLVAVVTGLMVK